MTDLFTPIEVGNIELRNRIVMAPLTRNRAGQGNVPTDLNALYYEQRASAGLIITEATPISEMGHGYPATPGIHSKEQVEGWKKVTQAVHARGGRIFCQLWHVGRISHPSLLPNNALPVAPSAIKPAGQAFTYQGLQDFVTPRELSADELPGIVADYVQATKNAIEAGFDGVEIHAANGYLLDQFLRNGTNRRLDNYGGSIANRTRLLREVLEGVTGAIDSERVGVRISPTNPFNDISDTDPQLLFDHVARELSEFGLAYLHVVEGGMGGVESVPFDFVELRRNFTGLYMANQGYDKARANAAIAEGHADLVAFGALYIANPDLVERFEKDAPLNTPDQSKFYGGGAEGYTDYPTL
ncbi:MAG TPA: alkene reductase [Methylophilaceae bacterium]|nr:alkene reductase [Methylophilaceae bacterium]